MIETLVTATVIALAPSDTAHDARGHASSRGVATRYLDSNVTAVWAGASARERTVWLCIRRHESLHAGHWRAHNPRSSASGAGQWLDSTWRGVARWIRFDGTYVARSYSRAMDAPNWIQDLAYRHVYAHGGLRMWHGTWCPGT